MFHALGFMQAMVGIAPRLDARRAPPLRSRGDAREPRASTRPSAMVVVPVMLRRLVDLGEEKINERDLSSCGSSSSAARRSVRISPSARCGIRSRASTTSMAQPRSPTRRSPRRRISKPRTRNRRQGGARLGGEDPRRAMARRSHRARAVASSSATSRSSRATPAAEARSDRGADVLRRRRPFRRAKDGCSSTAATTR